MNSLSLRCTTLWRPSVGGETGLFCLKLGQPVGQGVMPRALLDAAHDLRDGFRGFGKLAVGGRR